MPRSPPGQRRLRMSLSGRSFWRFPSGDGTIPHYVQRRFRVKTFGLLTMQLMLVLGVMVLVDFTTLWEQLVPDHLPGIFRQVVFYTVGLTNLVSVVGLYFAKDRYPANYVFMALTTLLSGLFWGLTRSHSNITMHFQIVGILAFTMCAATVVSAVFGGREMKMKGGSLLLASLAPGWLIGCVINALVCTLWSPTGSLEVLGATGFSFLLVCIMLLDAGKFLVSCQPDDFMSVIVSMDSSLLVIVSIPFFVLSFCLLHTGEAVLDPMVSEDLEAPPENVPVPEHLGAPNTLVIA
ncbi:unnamed protein product [Symbiodinium pilosum]|uniref:Uncharacterized protein n=1 Tax=Symbiodinium pilosum TaxID=2952 RepID=A0A812VN05_SYMPI|nr:unnamed protein product [Symbiodinium pilosum]